MDIITTSPKSEMAEMAREAEEAKEEIAEHGKAFYYRNTSKTPKHLKVGERIWYVEDGYLRGFAIVTQIDEAGPRDRNYSPGVMGYIISDAATWTWVKPIAMRGFQGWQYAPPGLIDTVQIVGNYLDPRPEAV